jgi:peptidoglycan/LPS O-acetylase OafA/YrhL
LLIFVADKLLSMDKDFKINNFDLLRIFAATQVLFLHSFTHLGITYPFWFKVLYEFPGVPMFFVMSGFLISASYERNNSLKTYFTNRALRIYPALWVCLTVSVIVIAIVGGINFINKATLPWFFSQCVGVIYTPGFLKNYGFGSYNGSLWTIPLELQFYLVLPPLYFIISKIIKTEKAKTIAIGVVLVLFTLITGLVLAKFTAVSDASETKAEKLLRYSFVPHVYLFFWGVLLQRVKVYKSKYIKGKGLFWIAAYIVFVFATPHIILTKIIGSIFLGVCAISCAYTMPTLGHKILKGNDLSYGVYIYHGLVLGALMQLKFPPTYFTVMLVFAGGYSLAFLSWIFVEKPILSKKKNLKPKEEIEKLEELTPV